MAVVGPNSVSGVAPGRHGTGAAGACGASAESLVLEWYEMHKMELMVNWQRARERRALNKIAPLE